MIRFRAFDTDFTLPLPALLMPFLAARLGLGGRIGTVILSLTLHEAAHLLAARLLHVRIEEIRLAPFGGSAKIENPYALPLSTIVPVAAAGPCANLLLILAAASAAHWGWISPLSAVALLRANLTLMLFNLIPALPLDGGRILFAALSVRHSEETSLKICLRASRALAGILIVLTVWGGVFRGKWNLTLLLAAVFLVASIHDERDALVRSRAERLSQALSSPTEARPARIYQVSAEMTAKRALSLLRPRETAWFVLMNRSRPICVLGAETILSRLLAGASPDARLSEFVSEGIRTSAV